jgi:hypothetical protein
MKLLLAAVKMLINSKILKGRYRPARLDLHVNHWICIGNLELLSKLQDQNKNENPIAVDFLFYAYPVVPLACRSNLAGRYL